MNSNFDESKAANAPGNHDAGLDAVDSQEVSVIGPAFTLYSLVEFGGDSFDGYSDTPNLNAFNNRTRSIKIFRNHWEFFPQINYYPNNQGKSIGPGEYADISNWGIPVDEISSVKRVK